jgi:hypothetical protein
MSRLGEQLDVRVLVQVFLHQVEARTLVAGGIGDRRAQRLGVRHMAEEMRFQLPGVDDGKEPARQQ